MHPGDHVKLHAGGVHTFEVVEIDGTTARISPVGTAAPGAYCFGIPLVSLVVIHPQ